jgi:hypothetical protein
MLPMVNHMLLFSLWQATLSVCYAVIPSEEEEQLATALQVVTAAATLLYLVACVDYDCVDRCLST